MDSVQTVDVDKLQAAKKRLDEVVQKAVSEQEERQMVFEKVSKDLSSSVKAFIEVAEEKKRVAFDKSLNRALKTGSNLKVPKKCVFKKQAR